MWKPPPEPNIRLPFGWSLIIKTTPLMIIMIIGEMIEIIIVMMFTSILITGLIIIIRSTVLKSELSGDYFAKFSQGTKRFLSVTRKSCFKYDFD